MEDVSNHHSHDDLRLAQVAILCSEDEADKRGESLRLFDGRARLVLCKAG